MWKWKRSLRPFSMGHACYSMGDVRVQFTGSLPGNEAEVLVKKLAGERESVPLCWLRRQIREELYRLELREGGWVVDIAVLGPKAFDRDTTQILLEMRPEFAILVEGERTGPSLEQVGQVHRDERIA